MTSQVLFVGLIGEDGAEISVPGYARQPTPFRRTGNWLKARQDTIVDFPEFGADAGEVEGCGVWATQADAQPPLLVFPLQKVARIKKGDVLHLSCLPSVFNVPAESVA